MIATRGLTKQYGKTVALRDLSLEIKQGEVFGLLGPNGSGKTTTIRLLLGLLRPTAGVAQVAGHDCWRDSVKVRERICYLPGELRPFPAMTGRGYLEFLCSLRDRNELQRATFLAEKIMKLDLSRKIRAYSTGMKQKLSLAQAFSEPVQILILDEPTSALDPTARQDVLNLVKDARARGQTVIFSGHVLSEVEQVCDRVAIMRNGRLMHVEDMHHRRNLRMLLMRFPHRNLPDIPGELALTVRSHTDDVVLAEHRGAILPLLDWLRQQQLLDLAVGTEDLRALYDQFHGPDADPELDSVPLAREGGDARFRDLN